MVRLPDGMRDKLKSIADANKRTMNAEIVARLEASLNAEDVGVPNFRGKKDRLTALEENVEKIADFANDLEKEIKMMKYKLNLDKTRSIKF